MPPRRQLSLRTLNASLTPQRPSCHPTRPSSCHFERSASLSSRPSEASGEICFLFLPSRPSSPVISSEVEKSAISTSPPLSFRIYFHYFFPDYLIFMVRFCAHIVQIKTVREGYRRYNFLFKIQTYNHLRSWLRPWSRFVVCIFQDAKQSNYIKTWKN